MINKFPFYKQADAKDCGPTCLKIIAKHYGRNLNIQYLRDISETTREGSNLLNLSEASEKIGFRTLGEKISLQNLLEAPFPCILHWNKQHYVVLYDIKKRGNKIKKILISDPGFGLIEYTKDEFLKFWIGNNADETTEEGIALLIEPTPAFYDMEYKDSEDKKFGFKYISRYLLKYKSFIVQLAIGLLAGSVLQLIFPFLINFRKTELNIKPKTNEIIRQKRNTEDPGTGKWYFYHLTKLALGSLQKKGKPRSCFDWTRLL